MSYANIIVIALGVSMDALVVAIAAGTSIRQMNQGHIIRIALYFGFFQFLMTVIGWLAGRTIESYIITFDHWVAFALLAFLGVKDALAGIASRAGDHAR